MRKLVVAVTAAIALGAPPAFAVPPAPAGGTAQATSLVFTDMRAADGNTIFEGVQQGFITGTISGTWVEHFRLVAHADGSTSFHSFLTVTGSAAGCGAGTMRFVVEGQGSGPVTEGHLATIDAGSATVDVHAALEFTAFVPTGTITYTGTYHCG
jgi:hypothetical protein